jgi:hypothetical protein
MVGDSRESGTKTGMATTTKTTIERRREDMSLNLKYFFIGIIILAVLVAIGAVSIPTEVKVSTNQSSMTYNLSSLPDQGITTTNLIGLIIIAGLSIIIFYWVVK